MLQNQLFKGNINGPKLVILRLNLTLSSDTGKNKLSKAVTISVTVSTLPKIGAGLFYTKSYKTLL